MVTGLTASMVTMTCLTFQTTLHPRRRLITLTNNSFPKLKTKPPEATRVSFSLSRTPPLRALTRESFSDYLRSVIGAHEDTNETSETRWKKIAQYITSRGGVVAAEELAPYLSDHLQTNESFMIPVMKRFDGVTVVDEQTGYILYRFTSLVNQPKLHLEEKTFKDDEWEFPWNITIYSVGFVAPVLITWWLMLDTSLNYLPSNSPIFYFNVVSGLICILQDLLKALGMTIFCRITFVVPYIFFRNAYVEKRNLARERFARAIESPDLELQRKLESATDMAKRLERVMEDHSCRENMAHVSNT